MCCRPPALRHPNPCVHFSVPWKQWQHIFTIFWPFLLLLITFHVHTWIYMRPSVILCVLCRRSRTNLALLVLIRGWRLPKYYYFLIYRRRKHICSQHIAFRICHTNYVYKLKMPYNQLRSHWTTSATANAESSVSNSILEHSWAKPDVHAEEGEKYMHRRRIDHYISSTAFQLNWMVSRVRGRANVLYVRSYT